MQITFNRYMDNPSTSTSVYTTRSMYKNMYQQKFDALMVRTNGQILYKLYNCADAHDTHYVHIKIPSEQLPNLFYDVVVKLYTDKNELKDNATFREHYVKFFSNDHAFVYTFAHAFNKHGLFITELKDKMSKRALTDKAEIHNPKDDIWYVKSLVFAYYVMHRNNLFARSIFKQIGRNFVIAEFLKNIASVEQKFYERDQLLKQQQTEKQKAREAKQQAARLTGLNNKFMVAQGHVGKVSKVANVTRRSKITPKTKTK